MLWHEQLNDAELDFVLSIFFYCQSPEYTLEGVKKLIKTSANWSIRGTFPLIRDYLDEELTLSLCNISPDFLNAIPEKFKIEKFSVVSG